MADLHQTVNLGPTDGSRFQSVIAAVRPNSHFSIMPSTLLEMLGVEPQWTEAIQNSSGGEQTYSLAEVKVRIGDRERTTICVFGPAEGEPVLGKYALDGFRLMLDEAEGKLIPVTLTLG